VIYNCDAKVALFFELCKSPKGAVVCTKTRKSLKIEELECFTIFDIKKGLAKLQPAEYQHLKYFVK
jgi:hypothetical protein